MADTGISRKTLEYASQPRPRKPMGRTAFQVVRRIMSLTGVCFAILFAWTLAPLTLRLAVVIFVLSFILDGIDSISRWIGKARAHCKAKADPDAEKPPLAPTRKVLTPWFFVSLLLGLFMMVSLIRNVGAFMTPDGNMAPLIETGEIIVFSKQPAASDLIVGSLMIFRLSDETKFGVPGSFVFGRIIAVPGDRIAMANDRYQVNGNIVAPVGPIDDAAAVDVPLLPDALTVPDGRYFIVQDTTVARAADSRLLGWAKRDLIYGVRFIRLSRRGWGVPLEDRDE